MRHELRTPLMSFEPTSPCCAAWTTLRPRRGGNWSTIHSETKELTALVNELVELQLTTRRRTPQDCDLGALCEQAAARVRRRTGREVVVRADSSFVSCRPSAIDRAIVNLIDNAAKFSPVGAIEVDVHQGRLAVSDRGPGITADDLAHIFDRFYRSVASRSLPGSGLGLAIVRNLVDAHGGTVFAEPRAGGGTTVGFTLPTTLEASRSNPVDPPPSAPAPPTFDG